MSSDNPAASSHDSYRGRPLDAFFLPQSVALIGATDKMGSIGRTILKNLITTSFGGTVYPVNPRRPNVLGIKAYPSITDVPESIDLAVIVTPASTVPGIVEECVDAMVKGAIIISAGFKEIGKAGQELEQRILEGAASAKMRIIGPNCLGVINPITGLNATFAQGMAKAGNLGLISQSGALCTAILDWSFQNQVGFSAFVSVGSMLDVGWGDLIYFLGDDPNTKSIVIYMETIGDAKSFLSAAREVALSKPILVIKAGRTEAAAKAAASHTGSLTGRDEVLDAAFRRCGVLRVNEIEDLFQISEVLAKQPRPRGPRLTVLTNAGGPGVLATDALIQGGGQLAELSDESYNALNAILPSVWSHGNPIDIQGDASPELYAKALEIAGRDEGSDGLLIILTPQDMTEPTLTAERLRPHVKIEDKPVLASWMGGPEVAAGLDILNRSNIPTFPYPDSAARIFNYLWKFSYNLRELYETPSLYDDDMEEPGCELCQQVIENARREKRTLLTEFESKQLLCAYGIPSTQTIVAEDEESAVRAAKTLGFPVVVKIHSETITHKTDVGGVRLDLPDAEAVRLAFRAIKESAMEKGLEDAFLGVAVQPMMSRSGYELILGSSQDRQLGPVLLFGTGGRLVEVYKDRALALPPLNTTLARRMMEQTRIYAALKGAHGQPAVDIEWLEDLLVRFSRLVVEQPWIKEIDINPLLASSEQMIALDARMILFNSEMEERDLPSSAIRPYPVQYISSWVAKNGTQVQIRPIRPEDEPKMVEFHRTLSDETVHFRYFHMVDLGSRVNHDRLARMCFIDYDREMALVAEQQTPEEQQGHILGVGRLRRKYNVNEAEFAIVVSDAFQNMGLGTELLDRMLDIGRQEKLDRITATTLIDNYSMQQIFKNRGFDLRKQAEEGLVKAELRLIGANR